MEEFSPKEQILSINSLPHLSRWAKTNSTELFPVKVHLFYLKIYSLVCVTEWVY